MEEPNKSYTVPVVGAVAGTIASVVFCLGVYVGGHNKAHSDAVNTLKNAQTTIYDKANHALELSIEQRNEFLELGDHLGDAAKLLQGKSLNKILEEEYERNGGK
jgi:hypothetical protein